MEAEADTRGPLPKALIAVSVLLLAYGAWTSFALLRGIWSHFFSRPPQSLNIVVDGILALFAGIGLLRRRRAWLELTRIFNAIAMAMTGILLMLALADPLLRRAGLGSSEVEIRFTDSRWLGCATVAALLLALVVVHRILYSAAVSRAIPRRELGPPPPPRTPRYPGDGLGPSTPARKPPRTPRFPGDGLTPLDARGGAA